MKNYTVMMQLYIKDWVKTTHAQILNGRPITVEDIEMNPTGLRVVEALIGKIGVNIKPETWKNLYLNDCNNLEGKTYDLKMSFDQFLHVLHDEGTVTIVEIDEQLTRAEHKTPILNDKTNDPIIPKRKYTKKVKEPITSCLIKT